mmetsp:Transcript_27759/g.42006  ORF Transcript_27759/g.42006 Transcript_27759/m.42006 type:complete len:109 (-) Transcript_27759:46-372(-)
MKVRRTQSNSSIDRVSHPYDGKQQQSIISPVCQQESKFLFSADRNDSSLSLRSGDEPRATANNESTPSIFLESNINTSCFSPQEHRPEQQTPKTHRRSLTTLLGYSES